jgi:hypothetical protein
LALLAGGGHGQDKSPFPLKITVSGATLIATAPLNSQFWTAGDGSANVIVDARGIDIVKVQEAPYVIKKLQSKGLQLQLQIPFISPEQSTTLNVSVTNILDAKQNPNATFIGTVTLGPQPSPQPSKKGVASAGSQSTTKRMVSPSSEPAAAHETGGTAPTGATGAIGGADGSDLTRKGRTENPRTNPLPSLLTYVNTGLAILAVLLAFGLRLFDKESVGEPEWYRHYTQIQGCLTDSKASLERIEQDFRKSNDYLLGRLNQQSQPDLSGIEKSLKNLEGEFRDLEDRVTSTLGPRGQLERKLIKDEKGLSASNHPSIPNANSGAVDILLPAAVNQWLSGKHMSRPEVVGLAKGIGLIAKLANHKDLSNVFRDATTFECPFEFTNDGPWLFAQSAGPSEWWVAPADALMLGMGDVPSLLRRLFEGMQNARPGFRFSAIYRPCRLQEVPGRPGFYKLAQRGVLQLEGSPSPAAPMPPSFEAIRRSTRESSTPARPDSDSRSLLDWISNVNTQMGTFTAHIHEIKRAVAQMRDQSNSSNVATRVQAQIEGLERRILNHIATLENDLRSLNDRVPDPSQQKKNPPEETTNKPHAEVKCEAPAPEEQSGASPAESADPLAMRWQDAIDQAAKRESSESLVGDLPRPSLYIQRVLNLGDAIRALSADSRVGIVHLKKHPVNDTFEVHDTDWPSNSATGLLCKSCKEPHSWQLAVAIGPTGAGDICILYPSGTFSKGNYASGYSALMGENLPSLFSIGRIEQPAQLHFERNLGAYLVRRKMVWAEPTIDANAPFEAL